MNLCCGVALLHWMPRRCSSHSSMVYPSQTVRIPYCGRRIVVSTVRVKPYRCNPSDFSSNLRSTPPRFPWPKFGCGPVPSHEAPDGPRLVDRCTTATCTYTEPAKLFNSRSRTASDLPPTRSLIQKGPKHSFVPMSLIPGIPTAQRAISGDFSDVVVHSGRVFCSKGDGNTHSSPRSPSLPP